MSYVVAVLLIAVAVFAVVSAAPRCTPTTPHVEWGGMFMGGCPG